MSEDISTLIGIIVDVSGSMRSSIGDGVHEEGGEWARSIFQVIDGLIKHDVSTSNHMFAIGMGASCGCGIFDIMRTLEYCQHQEGEIQESTESERSYEETIDRILQILQDGGAHAVRKWATLDVIKEVVSHKIAKSMLRQLESKPDFVNTFVNDCLPEVCKGINNSTAGRVASGGLTTGAAIAGSFIINPVFGIAMGFFTDYASKKGLDYAETQASKIRPATPEEIFDVVEKAKSFLLKDVSCPSSILAVQKASDILHGSVDREDLTKDRIQELMDEIDPFMYGRTPFYGTLEKALKLFSCNRKFENHKKLLFILSDGDPTDLERRRGQCFSKLSDADITTVGCFITRSTGIESLRLFSTADDRWEDGAKLLFDFSSKITTQLLPRTIFIKRGWKIDIENNETKLFLQVNHPDIMKDACKLARDVVCCQDSLADAMVSISLDIYINQSTSGFGAPTQKGGTCYANASAAVLHLSMKRILGREGGYPDFNMLRQDLIRLYGKDGANTLDVLQSVCPMYRLHCKKVNVFEAMSAVAAKRPVVARFRLTDDEWSTFREFYKNHPTGILTSKELDITKLLHGKKTIGHAVVLTSYNSECLRLMNSWGITFGDMGFFRVQNADILQLEFFDVFWTGSDLTTREREYYAKHGSEVAEKLINNLKGLQTSTYQCPLCRQTSKVVEYSGSLLRAECPKCHGEFKSDEEGNILALNIYLTSLSR